MKAVFNTSRKPISRLAIEFTIASRAVPCMQAGLKISLTRT